MHCGFALGDPNPDRQPYCPRGALDHQGLLVTPVVQDCPRSHRHSYHYEADALCLLIKQGDALLARRLATDTDAPSCLPETRDDQEATERALVTRVLRRR